MFKNIKTLSEFSPLSERLTYKVTGHTSQNIEQAPVLQSSAEKAKTAREVLMHDLDFTKGKELLKLITAGADYKKGDWVTLNKLFKQEFAKKGVKEAAADRLLKHYQEQVFKELHLKGDAMAEVDGRLGAYTLYAFALYFNLKRPKVRVPYGNPKLEKLINEDTNKAFEAYKKFPFAKNVNKSDFAEIYTEIKTNTSSFHTVPEKLGDWAVALWELGYAGRKERKIGFPAILDIDSTKYPYAYGKMELVLLPEGQSPIFVNKKGELFTYDNKTEKLKPRIAPVVFENPFKKQEAPKPKVQPKKKPEPERKKMENRAKVLLSYNIGKIEFSNKNYAVAIKDFKAAEKILPGKKPKYYIAVCHDQLGQKAQALAGYKLFMRQKMNESFKGKNLNELAYAKARIKALESNRSQPTPRPPAVIIEANQVEPKDQAELANIINAAKRVVVKRNKQQEKGMKS